MIGIIICKDLVILENVGIVICIYGGVVLNKEEFDLFIDYKMFINIYKKVLIVVVVVKYIYDGDFIILDVGSIVLQMVLLFLCFSNIMVMINSFYIVNVLLELDNE